VNPLDEAKARLGERYEVRVLEPAPWDLAGLPEAADPYWNEPFGAALPYSALLGAADARDTALTFFRDGRARLAA
jgi:hypothetical protein